MNVGAVGCVGVGIVVAIGALVTVGFGKVQADKTGRMWCAGIVKVGKRAVGCGGKSCTLELVAWCGLIAGRTGCCMVTADVDGPVFARFCAGSGVV